MAHQYENHRAADMVMLQQASLALPAAAAAAVANLTASRSAMGAQLAATLEELEDLVPAETEAGGAAEFAGDAQAARAVVRAARGRVVELAFTQYTFGLREPGTAGFYLSQRRAVEKIAEKLADDIEPRGQDVLQQADLACCVLLISQPTLEQFEAALTAFSAAWPIACFQSAARRTKAELAREREKYTIPAAPKWPRLRTLTAAQVGGLRGVAKRLSQAAADAEAAGGDADLAQLAADKAVKMAALDAELAASGEALNGAVVAYVEAPDAQTLAAAVRALDAAVELTHTACACWVGPPAAVRLLAERLGWTDDDEDDAEGEA